MYKKNLDKIIEQYISSFDFLNRPENEGGNDEGYKWRVISSFKKHWDIDASDFGTMFQKSMADIAKTNLINNSMVQPITGLINIAKTAEGAEFLRAQFNNLFAEDNGDLESRGDRVNAFMESINSKVDSDFNGYWKFQQPRNAVIFYLNLWRPEDNYLFKATEAKEWADCIEFADDFGSGASFSLSKYYKMCDELRIALDDYPELIELNKERVAKEAVGFDDNNHLLAFDIIYCSHYMSFYKECPSLGTSTKERIKIARRREQEERIEREIQEKSSAIIELESQLKPVPDLTGCEVTHKLFGSGIVKAHKGNYLSVIFVSKEAKFDESAILKGFLMVNDMDSTQMIENDRISKDIKDLEGEIKTLLREKDRL